MSLFSKTKSESKKKDAKAMPSVSDAKKAKPAVKKSMKDLYGAGKEKTVAATVAKNEGKSSFAKASPFAKATADKSGDKPEIKKDSTVASNSYRVLLRPLVTEKGSHMGVINKYIFEVDYNCNKIEVAKAIEATYGIKPVKVNMIKLAGKVVRRGRVEGRRKNWKKAIVTLPAGKTIQIYEGI
jgi:large subunit ribosomal protein L23